MAIYQADKGRLIPISTTTFSEAGYKERDDLQQLLKQQIEVIASDLLVISEEFGDWADSKRRIDLLAIDKEANLVVIELKRTEDGGHMELQALRYAAMVSALTFDDAIHTYEKYLSSIEQEIDARSTVLEFLDWDDPDTERSNKGQTTIYRHHHCTKTWSDPDYTMQGRMHSPIVCNESSCSTLHQAV